jgi:2'-5' RNA ligase
MREPVDRIRLFLGVEISMAALRELTTAAEALRRKARNSGLRVRWVAPETYHVTLKFLGWTKPEAVAAIADVLGDAIAAVDGFTITGRGLGAFPGADRARVLWAGLDDPAGGLARLAGIVEDSLEPIGFAREDRPFHAHVTLGRIREPEDVQALLQGESERLFRESRITSVTLFESVLKSSGSEYRAQARFGLGGAFRGGKRQTDSLQPEVNTGSGVTGRPGRAPGKSSTPSTGATAWQNPTPGATDDSEDDESMPSSPSWDRSWQATGAAATHDDDDDGDQA